jgi:Ca-activated chloride channel family protein
MGNYNDALLEQLADQSDGFYVYVNDLTEARRLFTKDLRGTIQSVAPDAKVQVEFDPEVVASYRLIGYENRAIADGAFRDPRVEAGAIGAGHSVTALYELIPRDGFFMTSSIYSGRWRNCATVRSPTLQAGSPSFEPGRGGRALRAVS